MLINQNHLQTRLFLTNTHWIKLLEGLNGKYPFPKNSFCVVEEKNLLGKSVFEHWGLKPLPGKMFLIQIGENVADTIGLRRSRCIGQMESSDK